MNNSIQYIHQLGELFDEVQNRSIFSDGKTFPDCIPAISLTLIFEQYNQEKNLPNFNLAEFVSQRFNLPKQFGTTANPEIQKPINEHIDALWEVLTRKPNVEDSSVIPLENAYVVPGGRFREVYYWDSYFTMLGLEVSGRYDLIRSMIMNFAYLLRAFGHIPNANRSYYLGRSQPPYFALMVELLAKKEGEAVYSVFLNELEIEYGFWMTKGSNRLVELEYGDQLNRYWDENDFQRPESHKEDSELAELTSQKPAELFRNIRAAAESGWDFSSRWLADSMKLETIRTTEILPVDLNCLLYFLEKTLAKAYSNSLDKHTYFLKRAEKRKLAINKYFWNEDLGFYFDYDLKTKTSTPSYNLGAAYPLFLELASERQAQNVSEVLRRDFLKRGGLITTLERSGQQWDAPNGWAPLHWVSYKGLLNYGLGELAGEIKCRWTDTIKAVYQSTGKITEKYNVMEEKVDASGGEYPNQDGFGWTNGVFLKMTED